ncbi:uncharacterized protein LOC133182679 [Saccostrea echinata]|uniref:uncharacterized protein LOC133182679 n=1 Tax=Saccostrea echinata TaxID=191078 RepID=UPI002A8219F2|nr:uncharacterized protein LOC133182679 [Saccostrea echinata]
MDKVFALNSTKNSSVENNTHGPRTIVKDGYDLDVYGLDTEWFLFIHIPALSCIFLSLFSACAVIIASFRSQKRSFFSWMRCERFVVYLSLCDALFNLTHSMDHLQMLITKEHVYPRELCEFYAFFLCGLVAEQLLMTNVAAINAFGLIYLQKQFEFGKYDWKLLLYTFGVPFVMSMCAVNLGYYGPSGSYCAFDAVKGALASIFFFTVPITAVLVVNVVLYILTWWKIHVESKQIKAMLGTKAQTLRASHNAAKLMSLFVTVFFIQWWALGIVSIWQNFSKVPQEFFTVIVIFTNLGGVLNGAVYIIIKRRRNRNKDSKAPKIPDQKSQDSGVGTINASYSAEDTRM